MTDLWTHNPFDELKRIQDRIDSKYRDQFAAEVTSADIPDADMRPQDSDITVTVDLPRVSVRQQGNDIILTVDMPGVDESDIDIDVRDDRVLEISARRKTGEKAGFLTRERHYMFFCRSIMLPAPVNEADVKAGYNDGVLEISIPVTRGMTPGEVPVSGI
jgi:HSP20 family protein